MAKKQKPHGIPKADFSLYVQGEQVHSSPPAREFHKAPRNVRFYNASDETLLVGFLDPDLDADPMGFEIDPRKRQLLTINPKRTGVFPSLRARKLDVCPTCGKSLSAKSDKKRFYSGWPGAPLVASFPKGDEEEYEGDPVIIIQP